MQTIYPVLRYRDARAAIRFLTDAFGFTAHFVVDGDGDGDGDGDEVAHAQLRFHGNLIMLGSARADGPAAGPGYTYLVADDPDALHGRATAAGADIVHPLTDQDYGSREFTARDPEGNLWSFGTYQPDDERSGATPMIAYEDGVRALGWLADAFGFRELMRMLGDDGRLAHGEMDTGSGIVMLAQPTPDYQAPRRHREGCEAARAWSSVPWIIDGALVYVDDLDAHHERARKAGATILSAPEDTPHGRNYRAEDVEGHRWMFAQR